MGSVRETNLLEVDHTMTSVRVSFLIGIRHILNIGGVFEASLAVEADEPQNKLITEDK